jgi:hypothetical protein
MFGILVADKLTVPLTGTGELEVIVVAGGIETT